MPHYEHVHIVNNQVRYGKNKQRDEFILLHFIASHCSVCLSDFCFLDVFVLFLYNSIIFLHLDEQRQNNFIKIGHRPTVDELKIHSNWNLGVKMKVIYDGQWDMISCDLNMIGYDID